MMLPNVYTAKAYGLFVDGLDVLKEPATPSRYGVDVDSISVTEAGSGGVSSMQFTIDDPQLLITIADGASIRYWDLTNNLPIFVGFLESLGMRPDFGQQGRLIEVRAYGQEALLDLVIVPAYTSVQADAGQDVGNAIWDGALLAVLGSATGLRTGSDTPVGTTPSSLAGPIGSTDPPGFTKAMNIFGPSVVLDGLTVRQAFETFRGACGVLAYFGSGTPPYFLSVDLWGGIRLFVFGGGDTSKLPTDYATLTIDDSPTGTLAAEDINWEQDHSPSAIVNAVYVKGAVAASTGWVVGDTTTGRRESYAGTAGSTEGSKQSAAGAVMGSKVTPAGRGTFTLSTYTPTNVHPGSQVIITDARLGFSAKACLVTEIRKTFNPNGSQNWNVSFIDGLDTPTSGWASLTRLTRSQTRGTRN